MMPSVIPARLQFQCGHAALVTLPRVKGETATQRNDRVAREKTAALARQCDFCAPSVAVLEPQLTVMLGNHVEIALSDVVEPTPVADLAVVVTNESEPTLETEVTPFEEDAESAPTPVEPVAPVSVEIEPEPAEPELPDEMIVEAVIASLAEEVELELELEVEEEEARTEAEEQEQEQEQERQEEAAVAPEPAPARRRRQPTRARRQPRRTPAPTPVPVPVAATPARTRRAPARRATPTRVPGVAGQRYEVHYQVERVIRATSLQDALQQVEAMGASDVLAITRED
jgi:hypothetical protein